MSPTSSFWSTSRVTARRSSAANARALSGSRSAFEITTDPTMILRRVSEAFCLPLRRFSRAWASAIC